MPTEFCLSRLNVGSSFRVTAQDERLEAASQSTLLVLVIASPQMPSLRLSDITDDAEKHSGSSAAFLSLTHTDSPRNLLVTSAGVLRVKLREAFLSTAKAGHLIAGGASTARLSQGPEEESDDLLLDMGCLAQLLQNLQVVLTDPVRDAQVRSSYTRYIHCHG